MNTGGVMPFPLQTNPMSSAAHVPAGMQTPVKEPSPPELNPPSSSMPDDPAPEAKDPKAASKQSGKAKSRVKTRSMFTTMSVDQKDALCKYIYDFMVQKEFTSPEGYLIVDVFSEVWKGMGETADGWRVAQHRFADLLRSAPQYFRLFRRSIRVANQCGWFARKGEKMVRLVLEKEK